MAEKPTYEELEKRIQDLEKTSPMNEYLKEEIENIFELSPELIGSGNLDGYFTKINSSFMKNLGYSKTELCEKPFLAFIHDDDVERTKEAISEAVNGTRNIYIENRYQCKDGSYKWIDWSILAFAQENKFLATGRDITERKRTEEELRQSDERFRTLFDSSTSGIAVATLDGKFLDTNDSFLKMLGYTHEELRNVTFQELTPKKWHEMETRMLSDALRTGHFQDFEKEYIRKDGTIIPIHVNAWLMGDQEGHPEKMGAVVTDITERKQTEEALRESGKEYRQLFESSIVGIGISDKSGNILVANDALQKITGYSLDEFLKINVADTYANPDDREELRKTISKHGKVESFEIQLLNISGKSYWANLSLNPIQYKGEDVFLTCINNIDERKQAENALRESETKYRTLFETMAQGVTYKDAEGKVISANTSATKIIGLPLDQIIGKSSMAPGQKAIHEDGSGFPVETHPSQMSLKTGEKIENKLMGLFNASKESCTWLNVTAVPLFREGENKPYQVYTITDDITEKMQARLERQKLEAQLQQAQKLESIGTLAGGIAHDFNNILSPMFVYLEMMLEDVSEGNSLRSQLKEVFNGAKRARDLVQQTLTFSRQTEHEKKPMKVQLVVREVLKLIRSSLPTTISISQRISNECELVMADPTQIHQIAMNLITNAYHAMEETGGKLTVNLKEVELAAEDLKDPAMAPGPHVCLTVADTGPGMDQDITAKIFDPYFTTKGEGKGTGLGLAVVHGIVKSHGGHINVYSEPGEGTEFTVYLPVIKSQETTQQIETESPIQKGTERILLVDDQDIIVNAERQMLEWMGYHVTARTSSPDALEAFRAQPDKFDLVITDMTMPNMTGDKLAGELLIIRPNIPIILCTGFSEIMSKEKAKAMGIAAYIMKPVVMREIAKTIREVLDKRQGK